MVLYPPTFVVSLFVISIALDSQASGLIGSRNQHATHPMIQVLSHIESMNQSQNYRCQQSKASPERLIQTSLHSKGFEEIMGSPSCSIFIQPDGTYGDIGSLISDTLLTDSRNEPTSGFGSMPRLQALNQHVARIL